MFLKGIRMVVTLQTPLLSIPTYLYEALEYSSYQEDCLQLVRWMLVPQ